MILVTRACRLNAMDDSFLLERQVELNDYLKSVLMVESVNSSAPLLSFLGGVWSVGTCTSRIDSD